MISLLAVAMLIGGCSVQQSKKLIAAGDDEMIAGNYDQAVANYQQAQKLDQQSDLQLRLALSQIKLANYSQALEHIKALSESDTTPATQRDYLTALCKLGLNDVSGAYEAVENSLQAKPNNALALALLGRIKFLQKQYPPSIAAYKQALAYTADESVRTILNYNLAMTQLLNGDFADADASMTTYLSRQKYVTAADNKIAGAIAYASCDHSRAFRHWQHLSQREKQSILDAIVDDSEVYEKLAATK